LSVTTAEEMAAWKSESIAKAGELGPVCKLNDKKETVLVPQDYEVERTCVDPPAFLTERSYPAGRVAGKPDYVH
jgi:hypothetical protein